MSRKRFTKYWLIAVPLLFLTFVWLAAEPAEAVPAFGNDCVACHGGVPGGGKGPGSPPQAETSTPRKAAPATYKKYLTSCFGSPEAYAAEIKRKESLGIPLADPKAAQEFKRDYPELFTSAKAQPVQPSGAARGTELAGNRWVNTTAGLIWGNLSGGQDLAPVQTSSGTAYWSQRSSKNADLVPVVTSHGITYIRP